MSSANYGILLLLFQSGFLLFLFLLWLHRLKLPNLCWIVVVRVDTLVLFLTLGEMLSIFSPLRIMFAVDLSYMAFIMLRYVPSMPAFWRFFFFKSKWMLNFVKGFLCIYWDNHMVFIFKFVNVMYHIHWFVNIEEFLHLWGKAHLAMMYFFIHGWILFPRILLMIFASMFFSDIGMLFSFFVASLSGFGVRVMVAS